MTRSPASQIAVVGSAAAPSNTLELAEEVGREIARRGAVVICGGRGGVMEACSRGAAGAGGTVIGILPGLPGDAEGNRYLTHSVFTGMGQARNLVIVLSAVAVIALAGGWGTLSEIALALKHGIPVVLTPGVEARAPTGSDDALMLSANSAAEAVSTALEAGKSMR